MKRLFLATVFSTLAQSAHALPLPMDVQTSWSLSYVWSDPNNTPKVWTTLPDTFTIHYDEFGQPPDQLLFAVTPHDCTLVVFPFYRYCLQNIESTVFNVDFSFTSPSGATAKVDATANFTLNYTDRLMTLWWNLAQEPVATFSDGTQILVRITGGGGTTFDYYSEEEGVQFTPEVQFYLIAYPTEVPEPISLSLLGTGLAGLAIARKHVARKNVETTSRLI